jgi:hypothetical protein
MLVMPPVKQRDPALPKLERWLLTFEAIRWTGVLELHINGGICGRLEPAPDLPMGYEDIAVRGSLSVRQADVVKQVANRLNQLGARPAYRGRLIIPVEDGQPGEVRERPYDDVYPAGNRRQ